MLRVYIPKWMDIVFRRNLFGFFFLSIQENLFFMTTVFTREVLVMKYYESLPPKMHFIWKM